MEMERRDERNAEDTEMIDQEALIDPYLYRSQ